MVHEKLRFVFERERRGMTQAQVARRSALDQATLSRLENGRIVATDAYLVRLAYALGWERPFEELREMVIVDD